MSYFAADTSFRLQNLRIKHHPIFKDVTLNFSDEKDFSISPIYFTVLIGPNGTGKSEILKIILHLMKALHLKVQGKEEPSHSYFFRLEFNQYGQRYCYFNYDETKTNLVTFERKGKRFPEAKLFSGDDEIIKYDNLSILPSSIIAQSIMLTDKFIVPRNNDEIEEFEIYKYLGLRNRPQQASTRSYVRRTVELIVENVHLNRFQEGILRMMNFLQLPNDVVIKYRTINTTKFFNGKLTAKELKRYFQEMEIKYEGKQAPYKLSHFKNIEKNKNLDDLIEFANELFLMNRLTDIHRSSVKYLSYNLANKADQRFLKLEYNQLDDLRKIGLISVPDILIENNQITLQELSSGEFHFFSTVVGLLAAVESKSLVLIDEPEISLHPNWQMKYLSFIRELFSDYSFGGTHFIIATHSHFLISDLDGDSGNIIGLRKENGNISSIEIQRDTFGWSAEQVLLDVFEVSTTRNYVVAERLGLLLDFIAKENSTKSQIRNKFFELGMKKFDSLPAEDPLKFAYDTIVKEYIND